MSRRLLVKFVLILASLAMGAAMVSHRLAMLDGAAGIVLYVGLYCALALGLVVAGMVRNRAARWVLAVLFAGSAILVDSYQNVVDDHLLYEFYVTMVQAAESAGDALASQWRALAFAIVKALLLLLGIGLSPQLDTSRGKHLPGAYVLATLFGLALLLFVRGGEGSRGLPSAYVGASFGLLNLYELVTAPGYSRQPVAIARTAERRPGDIVLVIDESIAARYLDINDLRGARSGLDEARDGVAIANFGVAATITHCSTGANLTLRYGGTRENYHDVQATMPSLWSYAKAADYRTIHIDAQRTGGALDNGMTAAETQDIDERIQFDGVPVQGRDMAAAAKLAALMIDDVRQLIVVNKIGAHFPVHDKYPDAFMRYRPVLERGRFLDISDTGDRDGLGGDATSWRRYRNAYRNTLEWNVGEFFDRLFAATQSSDAVMIYTADHGQTLHERGNPGQATHCTPDPTPEEGAVPLVVIDWSAGRAWPASALSGLDESSAFRIFPTLIGLMGYDPAAVRNLYGPDLASPDPDPMTFDARFNARLGQGPVWKKVNAADLPRPPAGDSATGRE